MTIFIQYDSPTFNEQMRNFTDLFKNITKYTQNYESVVTNKCSTNRDGIEKYCPKFTLLSK